jgi:hypothetical protein
MTVVIYEWRRKDYVERVPNAAIGSQAGIPNRSARWMQLSAATTGSRIGSFV